MRDVDKLVEDVESRPPTQTEPGTSEETSQPLAVIGLVRQSQRPHKATSVVELSAPPAVADLMLEPPKAVSLFSALPKDAYDRIVERCTRKNLEAGEMLFEVGDPSDAIYVIVAGQVDVLIKDEAIATLSEGSFFGEIGVLTGKPRTAAIRGSRATQLLAIGFPVISELAAEHPDVLEVLLSFLRRRLADNVLSRSQLFSDFSDDERRSLRERFALVDVDADTTLIEQGSDSSHLYVLIDGGLDVVHQTDDGPKWVASLVPGQLCGEISAITRLPAVADVRSSEKSLVLALPTEQFCALAEQHPTLLADATAIAGERLQEIAAQKKPDKPQLIIL